MEPVSTAKRHSSRSAASLYFVNRRPIPIDAPTENAPAIYIDADACPVKDETYKVARRCGFRVIVVANAGMYVPADPLFSLQIVDDGFDAADDWIVEHASRNSIVVTTDIPLAARCLAKGALALNPKGHIFTEANIGGNLANREFLAQMREHGEFSGGPAPFTQRDRSNFLQSLDRLAQALLRRVAREPRAPLQ